MGSRWKGRKGKRAYLKRFSMATLQQPSQDMINRYKHSGQSLGREDTPRRHFCVSNERMAAQRRKDELLATANVPAERHIVIKQSKMEKVSLYFTEDCKVWFLLREMSTLVQRSITYGSRERAFQVWRSHSVTWVEAQRI